MKHLTVLLCLLLAACAPKAPEGSFTQDSTGVVVTPASGSARRVQLELLSDRTVRVTALAKADDTRPASLIVPPGMASGKVGPAFEVAEKDGVLELKTPRTANMDKNNYIFSHANGKVNARVVAKVE